MEAGAGYGYLWMLSTILMPILLGLAIAYGSYETWHYRKEHPGVNEPTGTGYSDPDESPERQARRMRLIIVWSVVIFLALATILLFVMF